MKKRIFYLAISIVISTVVTVIGAPLQTNLMDRPTGDDGSLVQPWDIPEDRMTQIQDNIVKQATLRHRIPPLLSIPTQNDDIQQMITLLQPGMVLHYLQDLTAFGPRVTGTQACINAAHYLYAEFQSMGLQVRYHNWSAYGYYGSNIEATLQGTDPTSDEIYIICGHYDTVSEGPGADDDGSGVVAALAAAFIMKDYEFNHTVRFLTFSGEEQGLLGSYEYVEEAYGHSDNIVGVLNADMIGYATTTFDGNRVKVYDDGASGWITTYTAAISQTYSLGLQVIPSGYTWGSDHNSFWDFGYNAVFYQENYFNPYYHSYQDTIATMNITYNAKISRLTLATLASMAEPLPSDVVDPVLSYVTLTHTNMPGFTTCPKGDGPAYKYVKVTVKNTQGQPIAGIAASEISFLVLPRPGTRYYGLFTVTLNPVDQQTNASGEIRFNITAATSIIGNITIKARVQNVLLSDMDILPVKSFDMVIPDGDVDLADFALFAQDYRGGYGYQWRSDYSWDGRVNLVDFAMFSPHYGHRHL